MCKKITPFGCLGLKLRSHWAGFGLSCLGLSALVNNVLIVRFGSIQFERCLIYALHAFFCVLKLLCLNTFHAVFHVSLFGKNLSFQFYRMVAGSKIVEISFFISLTSVSTVPWIQGSSVPMKIFSSIQCLGHWRRFRLMYLAFVPLLHLSVLRSS